MHSFKMINNNKFIRGNLGKRYIFQRRVFSSVVGIVALIILIYSYRTELDIKVIELLMGKCLTSVEQMKRMDEVMYIRKKHLKEECHRLGLDRVGEINAFEYLINEKHKLIWCNVFKAASTTWLYNFNLLAGIEKKRCDSTAFQLGIAREIYPRPTKEQLYEANTGATSMFIVRHPFERLSSAYRDKIQNSPIPGLYFEIGFRIILKYRDRENKKYLNELLNPSWPTFKEFVRFILDESKANKTLDMHWIPYTTFCTPCHFDFDVIMKIESLKEEQDYLIKRSNIGNLIKSEWKNDGTVKNVKLSQKSNELKEDHFSQLTVDEISRLYELYKHDFLLFNYTMDEYYKYAKKL